jgi:hypothetical protein
MQWPRGTGMGELSARVPMLAKVQQLAVAEQLGRVPVSREVAEAAMRDLMLEHGEGVYGMSLETLRAQVARRLAIHRHRRLPVKIELGGQMVEAPPHGSEYAGAHCGGDPRRGPKLLNLPCEVCGTSLWCNADNLDTPRAIGEVPAVRYGGKVVCWPCRVEVIR